MGLNLKYQMKTNVPINFSKDEISTYIKRFRSLDSSNKGYITHKDLKAFFKVTFYRLSHSLSLIMNSFTISCLNCNRYPTLKLKKKHIKYFCLYLILNSNRTSID